MKEDRIGAEEMSTTMTRGQRKAGVEIACRIVTG